MNSLSSLRDSDSDTPPHSLPSISEESLQVPGLWIVTGVEVLGDRLRGRGSYGTVHEALWHGTKVAVKKLHEVFFEASVTPESKHGILKSFARELNILYLLRHPNIVPFFGVYRPSGSPLTSQTLSQDSYLVQELMWCALDVRNRAKPRFTLRNVADIGVGIVSGLCYLHGRPEPIIHRDLAAKNILLSYSGVPKIADLGVAGIMARGRTTPQTRQPGTDLYMPPEVKVEGLAYNTKVDIYSFGVILLELCIGRDPTASEAFRMNSSGHLTIVPEVERRKRDFHDLGEHLLKSLILHCLSPHEHRPTAQSIGRYFSDVQQLKQYRDTPGNPVLTETTSPALPSEGPTLNSESAKSLSAKCELLEEKVAVLLGDKEHLQEKLDAYLQEDRDEERSSSELDRLRAENARLQRALTAKEAQITQLGSLPVSQYEAQLYGVRAATGHRIGEVEENTGKEMVEKLNNEIAQLKSENTTLRRRIASSAHHGHMPNGQLTSPTPEPSSMPSFSGTSGQPTSLDSKTAEMRKLKHFVEKYKTANIELDRKLKVAQLELQQYESRQTDFDAGYNPEVDQLRSENEKLRAQLDGALRENFHLQRQLTVQTLGQARGVY